MDRCNLVRFEKPKEGGKEKILATQESHGGGGRDTYYKDQLQWEERTFFEGGGGK